MRKSSRTICQPVAQQMDLLTEELRELGVVYVGHGVVSPQGDHTGYFSHDQWRNLYMGQTFFHKEPILDAFVKNPFGSVHWEYVQDNCVASMRREVVGIVNGVTSCRLENGFFCFMNLGFGDARNTQEFVEEYQPLLDAFHSAYNTRHLSWRALEIADVAREVLT